MASKDVIHDVRKRLKFSGFTVEADADEISFFADLVFDRLTENLNIPAITPVLYNTYIDMVAGEILYRKKAIGGSEAIGVAVRPRISSKTEGDTTVSFARNGEVSAEAALDDYINRLRRGDPTILDQNRVYKG